jgi:hypothetical protein
MIFALLLLLAQDAPAPAADEAEVEEVVIEAKLGHTTMLFDKGQDGRLRNCRVMVSSGSQRRDTAACQATPVCYAKTADIVTDCRELGILETAALAGAGDVRAVEKGKADIFTLPKLVEPKKPALTAGQAGPLGVQEPSRESERQRVELPPLPRPPSDGPVVRFTTGQQERGE